MGRTKLKHTEKITHTAQGSLLIQFKDDEIIYRNKYLPDPSKVPDAKFICTVCTKSLSKDVRTGKAIFGHIFLSVLVCQECFEFYGDGVFSADEDGDEKYCRWCGQGGTLSLCSVCTCGFCMKCLKTNLKQSMLATVKERDWKCLICYPRPIYGSRAILWAAQEINREVNAKYGLERKFREVVKKEMVARELVEAMSRDTQESSLAKNGIQTKKRKHESEGSEDSSLVLVHSKKTKLDLSSSKSVNGFKTKHKRKLEKSTSESEQSDRKKSYHDKIKKKEKRKRKIKKERSSSCESDQPKMRKIKNNHKSQTLSESSDDGEFPVSKDKSFSKRYKNSHSKKQKKNKKAKKDVKDYSSDSDSETNLYSRKKIKKRRKGHSSDVSTDNEENHSEATIHKQLSSSEEDDEAINASKEFQGEYKQVCCTNSNSNIEDDQRNEEENVESVSEIQDAQSQDLSQSILPQDGHESQQSLYDVPTNNDDDEIEENVLAAIDFLNDTVIDISEVSTLISEKVRQFYRKKVNIECLNSYEDLMSVLSMFNKLIFSVHQSYFEIENKFEERLGPWKMLVGLEKPEIMPSEEINAKSGNASEININETSQTDQPTNGENEPSSDKENLQNKDTCTKSNVGDELTIAVRDEMGGSSALMAGSHDENSDKNLNNPISNDTVNILVNKENNDDKLIDSSAIDEVNENNSDSFIKPSTNGELNSELVNFSHVKNCSSSHSFHEKDTGLERGEEQNQSETYIETEKNENISENNKCEDEKCGDKNFEALQELLGTSSDDETKSSEESDSDDSSEINLDDSDLEDILKPKKSVSKIPMKTIKKKKVEKELKAANDLKQDKETVQDKDMEGGNEGDQDNEEKENERVEGNPSNDEKEADNEAPKKESEEDKLDSEAEIDMLTDLTKLKKRPFARKWYFKEDSVEESDDSNQSDEGVKESSRKGMKYKNESKKRREEERKELFGFLEDSNTSNEEDVTKRDLDVLEEQYATASDSSMSLEAFSKKMNAKWKELEKEQEVLNLQMLLASDSDQDFVDGDDLVVSDDSNKKKKKSQNKKIKEEKNESTKDEEPTPIIDVKEEKEIEDDIKKKEEEEEEEEEEKEEENKKIETDNEYEQFMEGLVKTRTKFRGLGSSSEDDIHINDEVISDDDDDAEIKKEPVDSNIDGSSSADDSDSSIDLFLDKTKSKSLKKKTWRSHRLLRMKLSDTDTSDEERWWQRRLAREKKKKNEDSDDRPKTGRPKKNKEENGSDKENKKEKEEDGGSSTLEISSTESSGSSVFRKKKKKKKAKSSDSDVIILSEDDNKKKKKKKKRQIGESSDDFTGSEDDVIDITQKSTQGESPGKGGRKNIRKVKTKHELAAATKAAAKEEEERKKRIAARQKLFNEMFEIKEAETLTKLVLDFDPETKTELISVDKDLVTKMKPHQAKGVKFMWDSCFESLSQLQTKKGSGCILAHCMGLGKTFQVISLVHTILKHKDTRVKTVLVVCPLSTVLNWQGEFRKWLDDVAGGKDIKTHHLTNFKKPHERARQLTEWHNKGGVMILGYEMFRNLTNQNSKLFRIAIKEVYQKTLIDPGADLIVCDEGHMLKNESTLLSKAMSRIRSLRRIVLTGTPMQNNLKEYHCMVQFVKPNLLGTRKEFLNQFVNPITNGQFVDSTETDVKVMKRRAHVLHKMLEGLVQRFDYSVLTPFLPPKHEYVISLRLSDVQVKLYQYYLQTFTTGKHKRTGSQLFSDWQALGRIWTHPLVLKWCTEKAEKELEKKRLEESEEESVKNSVDDKSSSLSLSSGSSSSSDNDENEKDKKEKKNKEQEKKKEEENKNKVNPKESDKLSTVITPGVIEMEINLISSEEDEAIEIKDDEKKEDKENSLEKEGNEPADDKNEEMNHCEGEKTDDANDGDKSDSQNNEDKESKDEKEDTNNNNDEEGDNSENVKEDPIASEEHQNEENKSDENPTNPLHSRSDWWKQLIDPDDLDDMNKSAKLILLFAILRECEMIEDKVLVFSQSLFSLDLIEYFLDKIDKATKENSFDESLGNQAGLWTKGKDYFRLDGSSSSENRSAWCKAFNREDNPRARLFLISTRAGGLGINLTAANRVVIFDASWNPSHDVQSIFRIYRFGQKKPCYVYRFIANGTMEEKVYERQVAKQSLSSRVVDEQQVHRHFSSHDLNELYTFTPPTASEKETPALPKDRLMAELLTQYNEWIEKYHEHDSLLENVAEEQLNEEERKLAWEDYENDKKRGFLPTSGPGNFGAVDATRQMEVFRQHLRAKYPNASEQEMNQMLQTLLQQVYFTRQPPGKLQAQQSMSTPHTNVQPQNINRPAMNIANLTAEQKFNLQRNHLYKKYGEETKTNQMIGNAQIKRNQNMNSRSKDNYQEQMRMQHQISLARVQNQMRIQQAMEQKQRLMAIQGGKAYVPQPSSAGVGAWKPTPPATSSRVSQLQGHKPLPSQVQGQKQLPGQVQGQTRLPSQVQGQTRLPSQVQGQKQLPSQVRGQKQLPSQVRGQKQMPKFLNKSQMQTTNFGNKTNQPPLKTQQQLRQEQMRQSILLQQLKQQPRQHIINKKSPALPDAYKRQLEEMKKRYRASRMSSNSDVSIVEIDDEPPTPSGSST